MGWANLQHSPKKKTKKEKKRWPQFKPPKMSWAVNNLGLVRLGWAQHSIFLILSFKARQEMRVFFKKKIAIVSVFTNQLQMRLTNNFQDY